MAESDVAPIKKEPEIIKPSGNPKPSVRDIGMNIGNYEFRLNELMIIPRIEVLKDGKLVNIISDSTIHKIYININPEYADQLLEDLINDFKIGLQQKISEVARREKEAKENK